MSKIVLATDGSEYGQEDRRLRQRRRRPLGRRGLGELSGLFMGSVLIGWDI